MIFWINMKKKKRITFEKIKDDIYNKLSYPFLIKL